MPDPGRIAGPVVIPNCVAVELRWTLSNGKTAKNVLHARVASGFAVTPTVAEALRAAISGSAAYTAWKAHLHTSCAFASVGLRDLRSANQPIEESTGAANPGTGAVDPLPPEVALVATLRTALAGRSFRGRVYLCGFDAGALTATGNATAGTVTDGTNFMSEVASALTAEGMTLCIAQPARAAYTSPNGTVHAARPAATADVTSQLVRDGIFDSQRRRK